MQDVEGVVSELQVLIVIDGRNGGLALADVVVVVDVVGKKTFFLLQRICFWVPDYIGRRGF